MAVHGYVRATDDFDFAIATSNPDEFFDQLEEWLDDELTMKRAVANAGDPLGGVATIFGPNIAAIQFVNFVNPHTLTNGPGVEAIKGAQPEPSLVDIPVARPEHLVALKLYAGGRKDLMDAAELVETVGDLDWSETERVCAKYRLKDGLANLKSMLNE